MYLLLSTAVKGLHCSFVTSYSAVVFSAPVVSSMHQGQKLAREDGQGTLNKIEPLSSAQQHFKQELPNKSSQGPSNAYTKGNLQKTEESTEK